MPVEGRGEIKKHCETLRSDSEKVSSIGLLASDDSLLTRGIKIGEARRVENHAVERPSKKSEK